MKHSILTLLLFLVPMAPTDVEGVLVERLIGEKALIKRPNGEELLLGFLVPCLQLDGKNGQYVHLKFNGAPMAFSSVLFMPDSREECSITNIETVKKPPSIPSPATPSSSAAADRQAGYEVGTALGNALGAAVYRSRLKKALNKACFDQHSPGWEFPDGRTVTCTEWSRANPREVKGVPSENSPNALANTSELCRTKPKAKFTVQEPSGLWYLFSCQEWNKTQRQK